MNTNYSEDHGFCIRQDNSYICVYNHVEADSTNTRSQQQLISNCKCNYCLNTIFQKLHFSKSLFSERRQEKYEHVTILHSKSLKKCHKNVENRLTNKNFMQEIFWNRAFSIVKLPAREVTIFPEKI